MTFGFLWGNLHDYPKKIVYYSSKDNTEDVITNVEETQEFAHEYKDAPVDSWTIQFSNSTLFVNM